MNEERPDMVISPRIDYFDYAMRVDDKWSCCSRALTVLELVALQQRAKAKTVWIDCGFRTDVATRAAADHGWVVARHGDGSGIVEVIEAVVTRPRAVQNEAVKRPVVTMKAKTVFEVFIDAESLGDCRVVSEWNGLCKLEQIDRPLGGERMQMIVKRDLWPGFLAHLGLKDEAEVVTPLVVSGELLARLNGTAPVKG